VQLYRPPTESSSKRNAPEKAVSEKIAYRIVLFGSKHGVFIDADKELYQYSYQLLLETLLSWASIFVVGALFHNLIGTLLFAVFYIPLRVYAGGYHARTFTGCYWMSITSFVVFSLLIARFAPIISNLLFWSVLLTCCAIILFLAPIADQNKPASVEEYNAFRVKVRKILMFDLGITLLFGIQNIDYDILLYMEFAFLQLSIQLLIGKLTTSL